MGPLTFIDPPTVVVEDHSSSIASLHSLQSTIQSNLIDL